MRVVCSSDWHPDFQMLGISRFDEVEAAVIQTVDYAIKVKSDYYLFTGDLADPDAGGNTFRSVELAQQCALTLAKAKICSIWLAGNHDICTDGTGATTLTPLRALQGQNLGLIYLVERPMVIDLGNLTDVADEYSLLCLPYTAPSHAYEPAVVATAMMAQAKKNNKRVIVAAHLMFKGMHPGSETTEMPRGREVMFPVEETTEAILRINGHYHRQQMFDPGDGGAIVRIPGSVCRLAFGEETNRPSFLDIVV